MAKRHGVTSKAATTPLRGSARFKAKNPNIAILSSHGKPLSSHQSNLKLTPSFANLNSKRKKRLRGKQTYARNICENVSDEDTLTSTAAATPLRRSPRFKPQNPSQPILSYRHEPLSSIQSNLKLTPSSANLKRSNCVKRNMLGGKQSCTPVFVKTSLTKRPTWVLCVTEGGLLGWLNWMRYIRFLHTNKAKISARD